MKIIKRSGMEDTFDIKKIESALRRANNSVIDYEKLTDKQIDEISKNVEVACENMKRSPSVEEIQDMVENQIMNQRAFNVARNYITYRYKQELVRKSNSTDEQILSLLECNNEEVKQENSNKNPTVNRGITWQVRSARISQRDFCCRRILWRRMSRESFIFMMRIILHSICTTAVWST